MTSQQYSETSLSDSDRGDEYSITETNQELIPGTTALPFASSNVFGPIASERPDFRSPRTPNLSVHTIAWRQHLQSLPPAQRELFQMKSRESVAQYITAIETASKSQRDSSRSAQIAEKLEPVFNTFNLYAPIANAVAQGDPTPSSFVLGGITCLLSVPHRFLEFQLQVVQSLGEMGDKLKVLPHYDRPLYTSEPLVFEALLKLYSIVLEYCEKASKFVYKKDGSVRSSLKFFGTSLVKSYDNKLGGTLKEFDRTLAILAERLTTANRNITENFQRFSTQEQLHQRNKLANLSNENRAIGYGLRSIGDVVSRIDERDLEYERVIRQREAESREERLLKEKEAKRLRILEWIPGLSFRRDHDDKVFKKITGTGHWLLSDKTFQKWKTEDKSSILRITGKPGCGKSYVAVSVVENLRKEFLKYELQNAVVYLYCDSRDSEKINPTRLWATLLRQMCEQVPNKGVVPAVERVYDQDPKEKPSTRQIVELISAVASSFKQILLVLDGLDECHYLEPLTFSKFCKDLRTLFDTSPVRTRMMILSRPRYPTIDHMFEDAPLHEVTMDGRSNKTDIREFITSTLSERDVILRKNAALIEYAKSRLLDEAEGTFLWIERVVPDLKSARTQEQVDEILNSVPKELPALYKKSIQTISARTDSVSRRFALRTLLWVANAERALSREELMQALTIEPGTSDVGQRQVLEDDDGLTAECCDLIEIRNGSYYLIHSSLKDFLTESKSGDVRPPEFYRQMQNDAPRFLGEACLTYLQYERFENITLVSTLAHDEFLRKNPFYAYAALYWGRHIVGAAEETLEEKVEALMHSNKVRDLAMQVATRSCQIWKAKNPGPSTPLHALSFFNLARTATSMKGVLQFTYDLDEHGNLPIDLAVRLGNRAMSMWLLQGSPGSPKQSQGINLGYFALLQLCAIQDWDDVIKCLAASRYDFDERHGEDNYTALHTAAAIGNESALKALLGGIPVDVFDDNEDTPLLLAAENDNGRCILSLLDAGADVDHLGQEGLAALHYVSSSGNLDAVNAILDLGGSINLLSGAKWFLRTPLHFAAQGNRIETIKALLSRGALLESRCSNGYTPLAMAAYEGTSEAVEELIKTFRADIGTLQNDGRTTLHAAAIGGSLHVIKTIFDARKDLLEACDEDHLTPLHCAAKQTLTAKFLLAKGASVHKKTLSNNTILHLAVLNGNSELVDILVKEYKTDVTEPATYGLLPLHYAAHGGFDSLIEILVNGGGADPDYLNDDQQSALQFAARNKHYKFVQELVRVMPELNLGSKDRFGEAALHNAAEGGSVEVVQFLLDHGAMGDKNADGDYPFHLAAWYGHLETLKLFIKPETINLRGRKGRTALNTAAGGGHAQIIRFLLGNKADVNLNDDNGATPLISALVNDHFSVFDILLRNGANWTLKDNNNKTPLHFAACFGNVQAVRRLLDLGAEPFCRESTFGDLPFHRAVRGNSCEIVDLFLERSVNQTAVLNDLGESVFHFAAEEGNLEMFEKLLEAGKAVGADLDTVSALGEGLLNCAASGGNTDLIQRLLALGSNVDGVDSCWRTPLSDAAAQGNVTALRVLLENGADVNKAETRSQRTAVMFAAIRGNQSSFEMLLKHGADVDTRDAYGMNALDYALDKPDLRNLMRIPKEGHRTLSKTDRKLIIWKTAQGALSRLTILSSTSTPENLNDRLDDLRLLGNCLRLIRDPSSQKAAIICFREVAHPLDSSNVKAVWSCRCCRRSPISGNIYVCLRCHGIDLCEKCHSAYQVGGDGPNSPPAELKFLEAFQAELHLIRRVFEPTIYFSGEFLHGILEKVTSVKIWFEEKLSAWNAWKENHNADKSYAEEEFPVGKFLTLVSEIFKAQENNKSQATLSQETDDEMAPTSNEGRSKNSTEHEDLEGGGGSKSRLSKASESMRAFFLKFPPDRELSVLYCKGHDFLKIPAGEWPQEDKMDSPFGADGKITQKWFLELKQNLMSSAATKHLVFRKHPVQAEQPPQTLPSDENLDFKYPSRSGTFPPFEGEGAELRDSPLSLNSINAPVVSRRRRISESDITNSIALRFPDVNSLKIAGDLNLSTIFSTQNSITQSKKPRGSEAELLAIDTPSLDTSEPTPLAKDKTKEFHLLTALRQDMRAALSALITGAIAQELQENNRRTLGTAGVSGVLARGIEFVCIQAGVAFRLAQATRTGFLVQEDVVPDLDWRRLLREMASEIEESEEKAAADSDLADEALGQECGSTEENGHREKPPGHPATQDDHVTESKERRGRAAQVSDDSGDSDSYYSAGEVW